MKLVCKFERSAPSLATCPTWEREEIAVAGRSNVGKSSLINALTGSKSLARTSRTPGRTQALNFFSLSEHPRLALVDLPGYGYARMPQQLAREVGELMHAYLAERTNLRAIVLLIDARREPREEELALARLARARGLALLVIATKSDKLNRAERGPTLRRLADGLESGVRGAEIRFCSAHNEEGIDGLRQWLAGQARMPRAAALADGAR